MEKATDGLVTVTSYPGETLLGADAIYDGVAEGSSIWVFHFLIPEAFPVIELLELPGISYNNAESCYGSNQNSYKNESEEIQDTKVCLPAPRVWASVY